MFQITTATEKVLALNKRIRAIAGGTSASKTISVLLALIDMAQRDKKPTLTSVVSESYPHLKRGAMRDFLMIMEEQRYFAPGRWNKTESTYTFETGSRMEFFSADQPSKVRGPRRDRLFLNEGNNLPYEAFDQLEVRTRELIFIDWNPVEEFWFYTDVLGKRDDVDFITLTYKDNEALSPEIIGSIEQRQQNKNWWKVYGLGQLGEIENKVFKDWKIIDEVPHEARIWRRGLDFGFTNDPTAIVAIYKYNGGYVIDEECYRTGMLNSQIADLLLAAREPSTLVVADSAEPKSIEDIKLRGVNIIGCTKGEGSVRRRIDNVQGQRISVTKNSLNLIKEYRNYLWKVDRDGKSINVPEHQFSHSMDAVCYGMEDAQIDSSIIKSLPRKNVRLTKYG